MSHQQVLSLGIAVILVILFLVGCGASTPVPPTPTSTPVPPTATPTPELCKVECSEGVVITCESSSASYESSCWDEMGEKGLLRRCDVTAKFEESGNVYKFDSTSYMAKTSDGKVQERREVTVTGGVFGDESQSCQNY